MNFEQSFYTELDVRLRVDAVGKVIQYVFENSLEGNAESVLQAMEDYYHGLDCEWSYDSTSNPIIRGLVQRNKPKIVVMIGGYYGYSTIKMVNFLKNNPDYKIYTIEPDPIFSCVIEKVIAFSGLEGKVKVLFGPLDQTIFKLKNLLMKDHNREAIDLLYLDDNDSSHYLSYLNLCKRHQMFRSGSTIIANNIDCPGAISYINRVKHLAEFKTDLFCGDVADEVSSSSGISADPVMISIHQ